MSSELERAIGRVVEGVRHWSPARWSSKVDAAHALAQALADLAAEAEERPRRPVPRLPSHLHLPDQLQVLGLDLIDVEDRLTPKQRDRAAQAITEARAALF